MDKTRQSANLVSENNIFSDITNNSVGIGTTTPTEKLQVIGNTNISGILTATTASISGNVTVGGNVSIAGTLTYEDVTNVDSIGLVTARSGVNVTGGSVVISSGGLTVSGVTTVAAGSTSAPSVSPTGDNNTGIFFPAADTIAFAEGGAESARFNSSGNLLVGTTSDTVTSSQRLQVTGGAYVSGNVGVGATNPSVKFECNGAFAVSGSTGLLSSTSTSLYVASGFASPTIGKLYIGDGTGWNFLMATRNASTDTTRFTFSDAGNFTATGNVTGYSDETLKDNIQTIPDALDKVTQLRGVEFDRNDIEGNPHQIGVIAQEVEKVIPEVVMTHEDGIKSVAYGNLVGVLIEAIKELKEEVNELKARLEEV